MIHKICITYYRYRPLPPIITWGYYVYHNCFKLPQAVFFPPSTNNGNATEQQHQLRLGRRVPSDDEKLSDEDIQVLARELLDRYKDPEVTKDPYMSPSFATDDMLQGLPPVDILVSLWKQKKIVGTLIV